MAPDKLSRRAVTKGAAWSIPALSLASASPAVASSAACGTPTVTVSGGVFYNFGVLGSSGTTQQQLTIGAQVTVANLPPGVTVTSITEQFWLQNRIGQTSAGPGVFFMGNYSSNWNQNTQCTAAGCSVNWNGPVGIVNSGVPKPVGADASTGPSTGWSSTVTNTKNLYSHTFSDGTTAQAWDANLTWTPTSAAAYSSNTTNANGCTTIKTTPSGRFGVNYTGVTRTTSGSTNCFRADYIVTVTLSNKQTLTYLSSTANTCPQ